MPEQPADPIHYDMKIPPEKKEDKLKTELDERGSGKTNSESSQDRTKGQDSKVSGSDLPAE